MTEKDAIDMCHEKDLIARVAFSLAKTAKTMITDAAPANVALAKLVRDNPESYAVRFCIMIVASLSGAVLAGITTVASITQSTIDTQVTAIWPTFAA